MFVVNLSTFLGVFPDFHLYRRSKLDYISVTRCDFLLLLSRFIYIHVDSQSAFWPTRCTRVTGLSWHFLQDLLPCPHSLGRRAGPGGRSLASYHGQGDTCVASWLCALLSDTPLS